MIFYDTYNNKYLLISTTLFFCSCHKPKTDIITPAKQLIERQIGERAQSIHFEYIEPSDGKDIFEVIAKRRPAYPKGK